MNTHAEKVESYANEMPAELNVPLNRAIFLICLYTSGSRSNPSSVLKEDSKREYCSSVNNCLFVVKHISIRF